MTRFKLGRFLRRSRRSMSFLQWFISVLFLSLNLLTPIVQSSQRDQLTESSPKGRELTPDPVRSLLLVSTLDGSLTALDRNSGKLRWISRDEPMIRVPLSKSNYSGGDDPDNGGSGNMNNSINKHPYFLPDPRSGSLYLLGKRGALKKLPFTIPQLVSMAPCKSSEGLLYTGKKMDMWLNLNPITGEKVEMVGESGSDSTCPIHTAESGPSTKSLLIGKSEYTISMLDGSRKWNVTFHDYASIDMSPQLVQDYDLVHFTSPSTGSILTYERESGSLLWQTDLQSPVIAIYTIDCSRSSLISIPFTAIAPETLDKLLRTPASSRDESQLSPTLYIGEFDFGLYAVPSLVDDSVLTISNHEKKPLLIEGPSNPQPVDPNQSSYSVPPSSDGDDVVFIGHYDVPDTIKAPISPDKQIGSSPTSQQPGDILLDDRANKSLPSTEDHPSRPHEQAPLPPKSNVIFPPPPEQRRRSLREEKPLIISTAIITIILTSGVMSLGFWGYRRFFAYFRELKPVKFLSGPDGINTVGKITFDPSQILGKGCEGTFVFKGSFEDREVAVKRILPECFQFADREVQLLKESDQHPNVIRYFSTETDGQFRYIALELCCATLCDWIEGKFEGPNISGINVLREATDGLTYLHSLRIVHRDVKPANVLLNIGENGGVKAMISDFGLCKKLATGRMSFSRRSGGIPGTEGWIAPEMMKLEKLENQRTTYAVDIFSLGCVYYYVLTHGSHPFGDALKRQSNILTGDYSLDRIIDDCTGTRALISQMISGDASVRPPLDSVMLHPIFWSPEKMLNFYLDVSDRIEKETENSFPLLRKLERGAERVVRYDWRDHICEEVALDLRKYRTYLGHSVRDLLRALRNKKNHYRELTAEAQASLGIIPHEFVAYWNTRFPLLLMHTYAKFEETRTYDPIFAKYYPKTFSFARIYLQEEEDAENAMFNDENEDSSIPEWRRGRDRSPRYIRRPSPNPPPSPHANSNNSANSSPIHTQDRNFWRSRNQVKENKYKRGGRQSYNQQLFKLNNELFANKPVVPGTEFYKYKEPKLPNDAFLSPPPPQ